MKKPKYHFKQSELYTIARLLATNISAMLAFFTAFKGKYIATWVSDFLVAIDKAEDLPDLDNRSAAHETLRTNLLDLVSQSLNKFNSLESYIKEVFPENLWKINIDAAGGTFYSAASNADYESCKQMLNNMINFMAANTTILENAGLNMPVGFPAQVELLQTTFNTTHINFLATEGGAEIGTDDKIKANNEIYKTIVTANSDAQNIFISPDQETVRSQYVLEHQLFLVRGAGVAGISFHVTDNATGADLQGATIKIVINGETQTLITDNRGRVIKLQLAEGDYPVNVLLSDYVSQTLTLKVEIGTVKRANIKLVAV